VRNAHQRHYVRRETAKNRSSKNGSKSNHVGARCCHFHVYQRLRCQLMMDVRVKGKWGGAEKGRKKLLDDRGRSLVQED
jgi:hypothetical protein